MHYRAMITTLTNSSNVNGENGEVTVGISLFFSPGENQLSVLILDFYY